MNIDYDFELKPFNTFGLNSRAKLFSQVRTEQELEEITQSDLFLQHPHLWLGGGSNIIMRPVINAWVLQLCNKGIAVIEEGNETVLVEAQAGEIWHDFVTHCLSLGYSGIENLSLIPGQVGAAPVQNIGAYGVEVKDIIHSVICFDIYSKKWHTFSKVDCQFQYRDSFFKHAENGRFVIWAVRFELSKRFKPNLNYGDLDKVSKEFAAGKELTATIVSDAVCHIREQKLPNPKIIGNVGSFFHNPIVSKEVAEALKTHYPLMPQYLQNDGQVKLAAGWLIDQVGLKGYSHQQVGVHTKQALVLVNKGLAKYQQVVDLARLVQDKVREKFAVELHPEPNFW